MSLKNGATENGKQTRTYQAWANMKQRVTNPRRPDFRNWGGRGIQIYKRWNQFENFLMDMGICPPGMTLERKNNSRNYEPGNCKWATRKVQSNNRRDTVYFEFRGRRLSISQWSSVTGISYRTLHSRRAWGWSIKDILTVPVVSKKVRIKR